eukprot:CAMPEP_0173389066 /NCGR_PEP_ID=MMETSP1356-20130122/11222_1 /TAXON_ID=77927 ORGANISM="Hemiselmis virescens, Strain PCC157" /NCGR_SAMPLE_ID=MMETSP1356 /ASSEMBLY_ACC=CAM_ASM_000847 /LENGTH=54 /DNA_ID=CAMNT_0014346121 /DNA_START=476 /DNA_END=637 /DNA_ORIENTATION=-
MEPIPMSTKIPKIERVQQHTAHCRPHTIFRCSLPSPGSASCLDAEVPIPMSTKI